MVSGARGVWAIDIGNNSLKAMYLDVADGKVEVQDFETIEHELILNSGDVSEEKQEELIASALSKFAEKHDLANQMVAISVAGQTSFARFTPLPPVEPKKVKEIVHFEAVQQIPFDINEVEWDYQLMTEADSPEVRVGIFAIKNEIIGSILDQYTAHNIRVGCVQMAPIALYNSIQYDNDELDEEGKKAIVVLDMGTDNTNIVICTKNDVWQRCIPMGGNDFTEAVADAFKLNFAKAEQLKRTAPVSKYARQIFQAMKPVFTSLSEEIQRSIGYYSSSHDVQIVKAVALGGGLKLQGLAKYLSQSLGFTVERPDGFKKLQIGASVSSAKFHENVSDYGIVYGLGLQVLELAKIKSNLLPKKIARAMAWQQKSKFLIIAAAIILIAGLGSMFRAFKDSSAWKGNESVRSQVNSAVRRAQSASSALSEQEDKEGPLSAKIKEQFEYFKYRDMIPKLMDGIVSCLPNETNTPDQAELYKAFAEGESKEILETPRADRKQLFITSFRVDYADSVEMGQFGVTATRERKAAPAGGGMGPGMFGPGMMGPGMMGPGMMGPGMMGPGMGPGPSKRADRQTTDEDEATQEDGPGFLVIIEGYSPYKELGELMDPAGVGKDQSKWGFITRLMYFDKLFKKGKFELFQKDSVVHFKFETGEVDLADAELPAGVGKEVTKVRVDLGDARSKTQTDKQVIEEQVLIDPMTGEEISKTFKIDQFGMKQFDAFGEEQYNVRDHWFRIKAKFLWKDAPELEED